MTQIIGNPPKAVDLARLGLADVSKVYWNLTPEALTQETLDRGQGILADNGALCVDTGTYTGRSPKDKFCVEDDNTRDTIWWGEINQPISPEHVAGLHMRMTQFLAEKEVFVRDMYCGADPRYRIKVRILTSSPWANLFADNMFINPSAEALEEFVPDWTVMAIPEFEGNGQADGIRQENFSIIDFSHQRVLIGGSAYTGEIKKGIFTVMNAILPAQGVLPMHCSSNMGLKDKDTAIFFGLSGTGKTTLSADPSRALIGDDEHGWSPEGVFNFEGGCYAKVIDLSPEKEPQIWDAIKPGAIVENIHFVEGTHSIDFTDTRKTPNTRVSYPLSHIDGAVQPSQGEVPQHIFFLTCDAFGVLPPISKLTPAQSMYHFIAGYTAKVAGTETGIDTPQAVFSACFGAPFLPLHPTTYADMLGEKLKAHQTQVWLINTGWSGGSCDQGAKRMSLQYTRAMIQAAMNGSLANRTYIKDAVFGLHIPTSVPGVPTHLLVPRNAWPDKDAYDVQAQTLAHMFHDEFAQYTDQATPDILAAGPRVRVPMEKSIPGE